jgi:hypothetical protein
LELDGGGMRTRLSNALLISLSIISVLAIALWIASERYFVRAGVSASSNPDSYREWGLVAENGGFSFFVEDATDHRNWSHWELYWERQSVPLYGGGWVKLGLGFDSKSIRFSDGSFFRGAIAPAWFCVSVVSLPAALLALLRYGKRPRAVGTCAKCGYDLRASPDLCPECGTEQSFQPVLGSE